MLLGFLHAQVNGISGNRNASFAEWAHTTRMNMTVVLCSLKGTTTSPFPKLVLNHDELKTLSRPEKSSAPSSTLTSSTLTKTANMSLATATEERTPLVTPSPRTP